MTEVQSIYNDPNGLEGSAAQAPPANNWGILNKEDNPTEEVLNNNKIKVTLAMEATNANLKAKVYKEDCIEEFVGSELDYFETSTDTPVPGDDGLLNFNTIVEMDINALNSTGTNYWKPLPDGTRGGYAQVCVETYQYFTETNSALGNPVDEETKVGFINNLLNISVSLSADYSVQNVNIDREDVTKRDVKTDYSEFITAYQCDSDSPATSTSPDAHNQGDEITICVRDKEYNGVSNVVEVERFDDLIVKQGEDNTNTYNFILNGMHNPDITTKNCVEDPNINSGRRVCYAKFRALARFFQTTDPEDLKIKGSVIVKRDGVRVRRNLRMALPAPEKVTEEDNHHALAVSGRRVEEDGEGSGEFDITVSLGSADGSAASGRTIGSGVAGLMSMAVGAAGAALMA